jgi:hypothetical protein
MQSILKDFLEKWVYPTGFSGPGVDFRMRQTERCLPFWNKLVNQAIQSAENDLKSGSEEYKAVRARAGYAAEGPFMSLKQMSTQILSVNIDEQAHYIDLQRIRARGRFGTKSSTANCTPTCFCVAVGLSGKRS